MASLDLVAATLAPKNSTTDRLRPVPVPPWLRAGMRALSAVAPGAAAAVARRLFFAPPRAPLRAEERTVLARGERLSLEVRGETVVVRSWGAGPTVLLVHGWGGHSGQMTPLVAPLLAAGYRAVAIDLPAHGESGGRLSSVVHCAAALAAVEPLAQPIVGLVAHSFGAAASTYAMARGLAVGRAVFLAPPARFETFWMRFQAGAGLSDEVMRRLLRDAERWLEVKFDGLSPADLAPGLRTPLLVLHGPDDREMPFAEGAELAHLWPGAVLRRTEGLGHLRILRDAGVIGEAVEFVGAAGVDQGDKRRLDLK